MTVKFSPSTWWKTDEYDIEKLVPSAIAGLASEHGPAIVKVYANGSTSKGWSAEEFMANYLSGKLEGKAILDGAAVGKWPFAFVMRSLPLVVIDIDGKNGGLDHAPELLGNCPPTLAEISKSGNGYHLYYSVEDEWDPDKGFARFSDKIGIVQGVDIKGVGCVYHHANQRWNNRAIAPLPNYLVERLTSHQAAKSASADSLAKIVASGDEDELLVLWAGLKEDLARQIPTGMRNTTIFAIASQLHLSGAPDWEELVAARMVKAGMDDEVDQLIHNVKKYAK